MRKQAIAQALAKNGINVHNIDEFKRLLDDADFTNSAKYYNIRTDAVLAYRDFFASSRQTALTRNRFSRRWMFNTLQGYVLNRSAEVSRGITKGIKDFRSGRIKTFGSFAQYLLEENQEL
jgi:hypothetical protein